MAAAGGHPSGFDYVRLGLAIGVLAWHTVVLSYGLTFQNEVWAGPWRGLPDLILPMFFSLSGFLIAGSLERSAGLVPYLILRGLRILPALVVEMVITACVMGPLVSDYPLSDYLADPRLADYFLSIFGEVKTDLPGVFVHNPLPSVVNGQFWTIPYEIKCYIALALLSLVGLYRRRGALLGCALALQAAFAVRAWFGPSLIWAGVPANVLFLCFLFGAVLYRHRNVVPARAGLAAACLLLTAGLLYLHHGPYFVAAPIAYFTVFLCLHNPRRNVLIRHGDYSYGIYLYAFPIQQLVTLIPGVETWYDNLLLALPLTLAVAVVSWHGLERRVLALRCHIPAVRQALDLFGEQIRARIVRGGDRQP
ncbi:acyltransferase family protein [Phaeospirillum tilakii]|uniref:Acyltransferase family protein n=1 Tax=Phaeospirillum tilakii TaxID=741673 RepID=A0ABW5CFQ5_9PROT